MTLLRAWWALLVLDLGQVALRAPGALTVRGAGWLAALYAIAVVAVGLTWWILRRIVRRTGRRTPVAPRRSSPLALAAMAVVLVVAAVGATRGPRGRETGDGPSGTAKGTHPNVLLVVIDTLRADHLGCYGYARPTSPTIDAFAAHGTLFANAYALSSPVGVCRVASSGWWTRITESPRPHAAGSTPGWQCRALWRLLD